jgi:hypothetical protein
MGDSRSVDGVIQATMEMVDNNGESRGGERAHLARWEE